MRRLFQVALLICKRKLCQNEIDAGVLIVLTCKSDPSPQDWGEGFDYKIILAFIQVSLPLLLDLFHCLVDGLLTNPDGFKRLSQEVTARVDGEVGCL